MSDDRSLRVLITRLSHIGDCILTIPLLNALRDHLPNARIAWVVERPTDDLLNGHPALDQLIVAPRGWIKSPKAVWHLRRKLRSFLPEVTVDPQSLTKSALVARMSGACRRIGLDRPLARELAPWMNNTLISVTATHVVDRSLQMLQSLGITKPEVHFRLPEYKEARNAIDKFVQRSHLGCGFAVINPGAGWRSRLWAPRRFGYVAKHLGQQHALPSVVSWAGEKEKVWAQEIASRSGGHALIAPSTSLQQLTSLLRASRLYVGCDTGPMHLAVSVGIDCVVLHGPTRPEYSGPYGPQHIAVQRYYQDGTSRKRRRGENEAMMAIQVEDVCQACDQILYRQSEKKSDDQAA